MTSQTTSKNAFSKLILSIALYRLTENLSSKAVQVAHFTVENTYLFFISNKTEHFSQYGTHVRSKALALTRRVDCERILV